MSTERPEAERLADPFLAGLRQELNNALHADIHASEASWQAISALFERLDARDSTIARLQQERDDYKQASLDCHDALGKCAVERDAAREQGVGRGSRWGNR